MEVSSSSSIVVTNFLLPDIENLSGIVNVYGKRGIGKSTYFKNKKFIHIDHEILKSKERTIDFMDMAKYSKNKFVLDDYELVEILPGTKEILNSKMNVYIVSNNRVIDIVKGIEFSGVPVDFFATSQGIGVDLAEKLLKDANGNMNSVKLDLEIFKSERDVFLSSKDYVKEILSCETNLSKHIDRHLTEHGNTLGIIHENYPDYSNNFEKISQSLSDSDIIDMKIYSEVSWDLMNYFNVSACLIPALHMKDNCKQLDKSSLLDHLRPGSIWTKTSNMLMKRSRFKRLRIKDRDEIQVLVLKANAGEEMDPKFDSYDLDSINQLSFNKIKPRVLTSLKKKCPKK